MLCITGSMGRSDRLARQSYPDLSGPVVNSPNNGFKMGDQKFLRYPTTEVHDIQTYSISVNSHSTWNCVTLNSSHSARQQNASKGPPDASILHPHILFNNILPPTTWSTNCSLPLYICMIYYLYYSSYAIPYYEIFFQLPFTSSQFGLNTALRTHLK